MSGPLIFGAEVDADSIGNEIDFNGSPSGLELDRIYRLKGRVGYDNGALMPYATIGHAWLKGEATHYDGVVYGIGLEWQSSSAVTIAVELLEHNLTSDGGVDADLSTASLRTSLKF